MYSERLGFQRTAQTKQPKREALTDQINIWLAEDKGRSRKQRLTAEPSARHTQAEFGEAVGVIGGRLR